MIGQAERAGIVRFFPSPGRESLQKCIELAPSPVTELRLYADRAAALVSSAGVSFCSESGGLTSVPCADALRFSHEALYRFLDGAASHSLLTYETQLRQGFLSREGYRIGIGGLLPDGRIAPGGIRSLNIRFPYAQRIEGDDVCRKLIAQGGGILVAGPPGAGKTTFLKKLLVTLTGGGAGRYYRTAVIDAREEFYPFAASSSDVVTADILPSPDKAAGVQTALRLFSPDYLILDEIGDVDEAAAMLHGANAGVVFAASIHARDPGELAVRPQFRLLRDAGVFRTVVFLSQAAPGRVLRVLESSCHALLPGTDRPERMRIT